MQVEFKKRLERGKLGSVRILNRIVAVADQGLEYDADQRQAVILMKDVCVDESSKGVVRPGVVSTGEGGHAREGEARQNGGESLLRAVAAKGKYLGQDRVDVQFAAKEVSRFTSKPEEQDWSRAKRLARYRKENNMVVIEYKFHRMPEKVVAWSDTDFAGCKRARRSTP
jgi:hypothetical protein